jgi:hypothetical protein
VTDFHPLQTIGMSAARTGDWVAGNGASPWFPGGNDDG